MIQMRQLLKGISILTGLMLLGFPLQAQQASLAEALYTELSRNGVASAIRYYHQLKKDRPDAYSFQEGELNALGYRLLGEQKTVEAIEIFKLNVQSFPVSPNTFDSLAEAFMKSGDTSSAITNYRKVLEVLPGAALDDRTRGFLKNNAKVRIDQLQNKKPRWVSSALENFISTDSEYPFGRLNPEAPPETAQWGQLAGTWQCTQYAFSNGQWFSGWPATWVFRYILNGFAIQDLWYQKEEDLPPIRASLGRDFAGTNLRIYDRVDKKWKVMWFHNGQQPGATGGATRQFAAEYGDGKIIMTPVNPAPNSARRRVVFHNMTEDSFDWKSETYVDSSATWLTTFRIEGKRVK